MVIISDNIIGERLKSLREEKDIMQRDLQKYCKNFAVICDIMILAKFAQMLHLQLYL